HQNGVASGDSARQIEAHQVGFAARIAEPDEIDGREPRAYKFGKVCFIAVRTAENEPAGHRLTDRFEDRRLGMAVEASGVFTKEINVTVPVEVCQTGAFTLH